MSRHISAFEARTHFGEILDSVRYGKEPYIVEKNGRPAAVIVDLEVYRALEALQKEERYVEEYSDQRLKEFLEADRLPKAQTGRIKKFLKSG